MAVEYNYTSHENFEHDSIDSLGYDWERVADPSIKPRLPLKVYLPQDPHDVVEAVQETRVLGQQLRVRSKGHSSNDLVLAEHGVVLCTEKLAGVVELDEQQPSVKVLSGTVLAELDQFLSHKGMGLPVIGDHNHITAGGFASVGGISPASHRHGLFVDNVLGLEYVDWNGNVIACDREGSPDMLNRVLCGTGQYGVIVTLTLRLIRIDKWHTIVHNRRKITTKLDTFLDYSASVIKDPGEAVMERGVWLDYLVLGRGLTLGQFSSYFTTAQSGYARLRNRIEYGYLHFLGKWAGRLPTWLDKIGKYLAMLGVMFSPRYASIKNVEMFTDRLMDSGVGDPTRMLIVLAPAEKFQTLFRGCYDICRDYRKRYNCFTFISVYVKAIRSEYLSKGPAHPFCEMMVYAGVRPAKMTAEVLEALVSALDDLCIAHGAFRYMHSKTVKDPQRRSKIDPNAMYVQPPGGQDRDGGGVVAKAAMGHAGASFWTGAPLGKSTPRFEPSSDLAQRLVDLSSGMAQVRPLDAAMGAAYPKSARRLMGPQTAHAIEHTRQDIGVRLERALASLAYRAAAQGRQSLQVADESGFDPDVQVELHQALDLGAETSQEALAHIARELREFVTKAELKGNWGALRSEDGKLIVDLAGTAAPAPTGASRAKVVGGSAQQQQ